MDRDHAREMRKNPTKAEYLLWWYLQRWQVLGCKFRRQQVIGSYIVDFACLEKKLVVELDGGQHGLQNDYDQKRRLWLEGQGFQVIRFWNNEVLGSTESVLEMIYQAVQ